MQRARFPIFVVILSLSVLLLSAPAGAAGNTQDPFVVRPLGPFSLLSNPASALDTTHLTLQAAFASGIAGSETSKLLAYFEPDTGLGAGALHWFQADLSGGVRVREIGYTVARRLGNNLDYGITVKHVKREAEGAWVVNIGLMTRNLGPLRVGLAVNNLIGHSDAYPTRVTGSLGFELTERMSLAAFLATQGSGDPSQREAGIAFDFPFSTTGRLRLGRGVNLADGKGYWIGALEIDWRAVIISASIAHDDAENQRLAVGLAYRF